MAADRIDRLCAAIAASGVFDGSWYLASNPDVAAAGIDPVFHYARYGINEGRSVNPEFEPLLEDILANLSPAESSDKWKDPVPVVFAVNDAYAPYLGVTLASLIQNATSRRCYQIYIFYNVLSSENRTILRCMSTENVRIEPCFVGDLVKDLIAGAFIPVI